MRTFILAALLLFSSLAQANQISLSFGPSLDGVLSAKKMLGAAYEFQWGSPSLSIESGVIAEPGGVNLYAGLNPGIHVVTEDGFTARIGFGPVCFSRTDDRLSSLPEFHIQAQLGLDMKSWETGVRFDHFSNAGIFPPNPGLDMASIYIGIPFGGTVN